MKGIYTLVFSMLCSITFAQGIEFMEGNFNQALEKAREEQKLIFLDAYATWCGPCKRMAKYEFTKEDVGTFYNEQFINVKMDMESPQGRDFQKKYPVGSFPTLFFIDGDGEVVLKAVGAREGAALISLGKDARSKVDYSKDFAEQYEQGERSPQLVHDYVAALRKSGKSTLKVANEYLNTHKDKTDDLTLKIILEACTEADSRIFDLLIENRKKIESITSKERVAQSIREACLATAKKAIDFQVYDLQEFAKETIDKYLPEEAENLKMQTDLDYFLSLKDANRYLECCKENIQRHLKDKPEEVMILVDNIYTTFHRNLDAMNFAEKYGVKALKDSENAADYLLLAKVLYQNGNSKEATKYAEKAKELSSDGKLLEQVDSLLKIIQNS